MVIIAEYIFFARYKCYGIKNVWKAGEEEEALECGRKKRTDCAMGALWEQSCCFSNQHVPACFFQVKYLLSGLFRWGTVFTVCKNVISHPRKIKKTRDFKRLREIV